MQSYPPNLAMIGYGILAATASHDGCFASYGEGVYDVLSERLGWRARWNGHGWPGPVKGICCDVARINKANDEPLLASLVRRADGSIGKGYATAVAIRYGITLTTDAQIQAHADAEAAKCWAYFALRLRQLV